jgi:hypothetical protein
MPIESIRLRGEALPAPADKEVSEYYTFKGRYAISGVLRGDAKEESVKLTDDDILEIVLEDDTVWIGDRNTLDELFPDVTSPLRGDADEWILPAEIIGDDVDRNLVKKAAIKLFSIFSKKKAVGPFIRNIAEKLEEKQLGAVRGLCICENDFSLTPFDKDAAVSGPFLLFVHGTASSTTGSFDKLQGSKLWQYMRSNYPANHVLSFQHETLTKSPLQNVLDLVVQMPAEGSFDVVSHSRGGLVADLLCRFASYSRGFGSEEILYLEKEGRNEELKLLEAIEKEIRNKNIKVRKQVRVACPAQGTTLASQRLNTFFNLTFNLLGIATAQSANPVYVTFKELIMAAIECKDDTDVLPGIEAMNPQSPFIKVLNYAGSTIEIETPLMVIAGNSRISLRWKGLLVLASKLFYTAANDLVVNTRSMYDGIKRGAGKGFYYFEQSPDTNHFGYFENESSQDAIFSALQYSGEGRLQGFEPISQNLRTDLDRNALLGLDGGKVFRDEVSGRKPIVLMLPGIMGSNLQVKDNVVWINYLRFLTGELTRLEYSAANNNSIKPHSLIKTSYKRLADYLDGNYDVVTFPFDWRKPLLDCTQSLEQKVLELMKYNQPIKIIGHSMGGVLVRDFILNHQATWTKLNALTGFKLLMLGSPLGGSFRIPYVLFGFDDIITKLAKIDIRNSKKDLLKVFSNLPGLLSLLPLQKDKDNDFSNVSVWQKMQAASGDNNWPIPDKTVLKAFGDYRDKVSADADSIDYANVIYIAGSVRPGKHTPCGYRIVDGKLEFLSTLEGDESVTWASGIPEKLKAKGKVYYSTITHGELANDASLFGAISDVLEKGETNKLRTTPPAIRSTETLFVTRQVDDFDLSEEGVERTLLGLNAADDYKPVDAPIQVTITNGDLRYARYPVLAGHFAHDGILSSESAIDKQLNGELTKRLALGLHPDLIGDAEVILTDKAPDDGFQGTIIVGLGNQGELTPYLLMRSVEQGIAKYLAIINVKSNHSDWAEKRQRIGVSVLAVAGSYGGLTLESSLRSVFTGIQQANQNLTRIYGGQVKTVEEVEVIEIYLDRALGAIHAVRQFERDENKTLNLRLHGNSLNHKPGRRERMPVDNTADWWTRIYVRQVEQPIGSTEKRQVLKMTISTNGAREEERDLVSGSETLIAMIEEMSLRNRWSVKLAKTMFELLIPNDFKDQVRRQSNINWIVDKQTAAFPWELLQDTSGNALPLCVHAGMIRQLATRDYRLRIQPVGVNNALVIGDPDLKGSFHQLPGALEEGKKVAEILTARNYETTRLLNSAASETLMALFSNDYKIVHLAGHGVYNAENPAASGMLLGKNAFLTTAEIAQMSTVPELVFVNCCYLGQMDANTEMLRQQRYRLAANIGTQLIENGVKAVVVAGWAVDDSAALSFAGAFYAALFGGNSFGEAVKRARRKIYEEHGHRSNTWGAYQCYGDPFYRITQPGYSNEQQYDFVIAEQAEIELANLLYSMNTGISGREESIVKALSRISEAVDRSGIRNATIIEREARVYNGLGLYGPALEKLENLMQQNRASFPFSAMEQYCNVKAKHLVAQLEEANAALKDGAEKLTNAEATISEMQKVVKNIDALMQFGETPERLSMMGSTWKRMLLLIPASRKKEKLHALEQAALYYKKAWEASKRKDPYPLNNWLQLQKIVALSIAPAKAKPGAGKAKIKQVPTKKVMPEVKRGSAVAE